MWLQYFNSKNLKIRGFYILNAKRFQGTGTKQLCIFKKITYQRS